MRRAAVWVLTGAVAAAGCAGPNKTERYLWKCRGAANEAEACIDAWEDEQREAAASKDRTRRDDDSLGPGDAFEGAPATSKEPGVAAEPAIERPSGIDDRRRLLHADKLHKGGVALTASGAVVTGIGGIMFLAGLATLGSGGGGGGGPNCTVGKPCGNTCIEATDTCHIPPPSSPPPNPDSGASNAFLIGSAATLAVGLVALFTGIALLQRAKEYGYGSNVQIGAASIRISF